MSMRTDFDVIIIGGGSAGSAAACRAVEEGLSVCVAERLPGMGGTATYGGINRFEQCAGTHGLHEQLAQELYSEGSGGGTKEFPNSQIVGRYFDESETGAEHKLFTECPWALSSIGAHGYGMFFSRNEVHHVIWNPFAYLPEALDAILRKRLRRAVVLLNTELADCETSGDRITAVRVRNRATGVMSRLTAKVYLDCSGDIVLSRAAGCAAACGSEPERQYGESLAPDEYENTVNGCTLVFNVESLRERHIDEVPSEFRGTGDRWLRDTIAANGVGPVSCFTRYPHQGDININMLPTMEGAEYLSYPPDEAYRVCLGRVWAYWHFLQTERGLDHMRMKHVFPIVGVRESYRLVGEYVLTQTDCQAGLFRQPRADSLIAYGAHSLDTHGARSKKHAGQIDTVMKIPYGVPYDCLQPKEYTNLLVACRGASFSHLAASVTRLIVTMSQLGEAAAYASADAIRRGVSVKEVNVAYIREKLRAEEYEARIARNLVKAEHV